MLEEKLLEAEYAVEATDCEIHLLWSELSTDSTWKVEMRNVLRWEQDPRGFLVTVGHLHAGGEYLPVNVSVTFAKINGVVVMFYHPTSRVVDWDMVDRWVNNVVMARTRKVQKTNAMNFHLVVAYVRGR